MGAKMAKYLSGQAEIQIPATGCTYRGEIREIRLDDAAVSLEFIWLAFLTKGLDPPQWCDTRKHHYDGSIRQVEEEGEITTISLRNRVVIKLFPPEHQANIVLNPSH